MTSTSHFNKAALAPCLRPRLQGAKVRVAKSASIEFANESVGFCNSKALFKQRVVNR
jgi:hypothetical protein